MTTEECLPKISIAIPTLNEGGLICSCLNSVFGQDYPKKLLEVFVIDGGSTDKTLTIARNYDVNILFDVKGDPEIAKMLALQKSSGDLFFYLDADMELACIDWLRKMVYPLISDSEIVGTFTRFLPRKSDPTINRYLSYHELQCDPTYAYFCKEIKNTIIESKASYEVCLFEPRGTPPVSVIVYRTNMLKRAICGMDKFMDIDIPVILSKQGYNKFAYVSNAGIYHLHATTLTELIKKRVRNLEKVYLPAYEGREFKWFDTTRKSALKVILWIIYANLLLPSFFTGVIKSARYKDIACLYEPFVTPLITDAIILGFLKNKKGRNMISTLLKSLPL